MRDPIIEVLAKSRIVSFWFWAKSFTYSPSDKRYVMFGTIIPIILNISGLISWENAGIMVGGVWTATSWYVFFYVLTRLYNKRLRQIAIQFKVRYEDVESRARQLHPLKID